MMRSCLALAAICLADATPPVYPRGYKPQVVPASAPAAGVFTHPGGADGAFAPKCAINGVLIADELMNSIIFIWQGINKCGATDDAAQCTSDVGNAIQAVNSMINTILKTVEHCGALLDGRAQCGMAIGQVTSSMAGIVGTSGGIAEHCQKTMVQPVPGLAESFRDGEIHFTSGLAHCIVDVKNLVKIIMKASVDIADAPSACKDPSKGPVSTEDHDRCAANVMNIISAVAELGQYIAGAVGHCSKPQNQPSACASEVLGLLRNLGEMSAAGVDMHQKCKPTDADRLYLTNGKSPVDTPASSSVSGSSFTSFALAALLPLTAVMSFVAGRRMAKPHQAPMRDMDMSVGEE